MGLDLSKLKNLFVVTEDVDKKEISENNDKTEQNDNTTQKNDAKTLESNNDQTIKDDRIKKTLRNDNKSNINTTDPTNISIPNTNQMGVFDQKIFESLDQALKKSNLPGEDYIEMMEALDAMKNIPMDESVKIQSVLATLSTKGLTKDKVIQSAEYYITELDKEKKKFVDVVKKQTDEQVIRRQKEIEALESLCKAKATEIARLTEEINKNQQEAAKIKSLLTEAEAKIKGTEQNFYATFEFFVTQIRTNINKLK